MKDRTTPETITSLQPNEIFVFESNYNGMHNLQALQFGAKQGESFTLNGNTFGIPTVYENIIYSIKSIDFSIRCFIRYSKQYPHFTFLVTKIGCGLAGYEPKDIAPFFKEAVNIENIHLPAEFWDVLNEKI